MRLVLSWLREFVDLDVSAEEIAETIGLRGFEVAALEYLDDGDAVIDFEITANRPDCLSVLGLAREVATAYDRPIAAPSTDPGARVRLATLPIGPSDRVSVTIEEQASWPQDRSVVAVRAGRRHRRAGRGAPAGGSPDGADRRRARDRAHRRLLSPTARAEAPAPSPRPAGAPARRRRAGRRRGPHP